MSNSIGTLYLEDIAGILEVVMSCKEFIDPYLKGDYESYEKVCNLLQAVLNIPDGMEFLSARGWEFKRIEPYQDDDYMEMVFNGTSVIIKRADITYAVYY